MAHPLDTTTALWPKAIATVTACTYTAGVGRAMVFGLPTSRHFLISYNYFVGDDLHTGQFTSKKAVPQGTLFPLAYNPAAAHENEKSRLSPSATHAPLFLVGILGSVVLSLIWLAILRGCQ